MLDTTESFCAVEHKDCASRRAAGSHDGLRGRSMAPSRKAEPAAEPRFPFTFSWETHLQGVDMQEQLEIIDLGDAMVETRCVSLGGPLYDNIYGPGRWNC